MPLMPGDVSCLKCGKRFAQPIPKVVLAPEIKAQAEFQEPVLAGTEYLCPKCQAILEPGSTQCSGCAVPFAYPVPVYKMSFREAEQLKREQEQAKREQEKLEREEAARQKAEAQELKNEEARRKARALKDKLTAAVKPVPVGPDEQDEYIQAKTQEIAARIEAERIEEEREASEHEAVVQAEARSCPHCNASMTPGNYVCADCGTVFDKPVSEPIPKFNTRKSASALTKMVAALVVVCLTGLGITAAINSSHSANNLPTYTAPPVVAQAPVYTPPPRPAPVVSAVPQTPQPVYNASGSDENNSGLNPNPPVLEGNQSSSDGSQSGSTNDWSSNASPPSQPSIDQQIEDIYARGTTAYNSALSLYAKSVDPNDPNWREAEEQKGVVTDAMDKLYKLQAYPISKDYPLSEAEKAGRYHGQLLQDVEELNRREGGGTEVMA